MSADVAKPTMANLRPFWGRLTVLPSPVDEVQRDSGVIIPMDPSTLGTFKRGIVLHCAEQGLSPGSELPEGAVVYYENGKQIGDVVVVDITDVWAYVAEGDDRT